MYFICAQIWRGNKYGNGTEFVAQTFNEKRFELKVTLPESLKTLYTFFFLEKGKEILIASSKEFSHVRSIKFEARVSITFFTNSMIEYLKKKIFEVFTHQRG